MDAHQPGAGGRVGVKMSALNAWEQADMEQKLDRGEPIPAEYVRALQAALAAVERRAENLELRVGDLEIDCMSMAERIADLEAKCPA